jgi:hypothetical protein
VHVDLIDDHVRQPSKVDPEVGAAYFFCFAVPEFKPTAVNLSVLCSYIPNTNHDDSLCQRYCHHLRAGYNIGIIPQSSKG